MYRLVLLTAISGLLAACSGQRVVNFLTPNNGYKLTENIAYGPEPRQGLDVYVPRDAAPDAPVVVFFYGGRWSQGSKHDYRFVGQALTARGFVAVIPDYRLYPQVTYPAFVEDGAAAVAWAHDNIAGYNGSPDKLIVMGHSAGAHTAAMLALDSQWLEAAGGSRAWLAGLIGISGPYDFDIDAADLQEIFGPPSDYPASQPINFVDGNNPPALLLHGEADTTVHAQDSKLLQAKIEQAGGPARIKLYPGVGHIRIIAALAAPLRFLGDQLADIVAFVEATAGPPGGSRTGGP